MGETWNKECLDAVLVPSGLLIMVLYHLRLLILHQSYKKEKEQPTMSNGDDDDNQQNEKDQPTTSMSHDHFYRGLWVKRMMKVDCKDRGQALAVINSSVTASFTLSTISMTVSALIGSWFGSTSIFPSTLIYGNTSQSILALKHAGLLICFLLAFAAFLQSARCLVHSTFLLSMPYSDVDINHVKAAVEYGSECWSVGMHALYFATTLLMWVFGPIPMFVSSLVMVAVLHKLEWNTKSLNRYRLLKRGPSGKNYRYGYAAGTANGDGMDAVATNTMAAEAAVAVIAQDHHG